MQIYELKCRISKQLIVDTDADEIVRNPWRGNPNLGFETEEYCAYDGTAVASVTLNMSGEIERFSSYELPEEEKIVDSYQVERFEYHFIKMPCPLQAGTPVKDIRNGSYYVLVEGEADWDRYLERIHLKEMDTLYVLGDILDRGPHPIRIILKIMEMPNVVCLTGNHELMALECLEFLMQEITKISIEKVDEKMLENLVTWQYNGSKSTIDEFRTLSREMQYEVIDFIKDFMIYEELTVNGKNYLLVHGGLGNYYLGKDIEEYSLKELIWDRAEYDIQYFEETYVVTGHTPTQGILGNPKPGYIYKENHHIAIDCGCNRRNGRLAAVCLETGQEYYVEKS